MVGGAEGAAQDDRHTLRELACGAVDARHLECLVALQRGQEPRKPTRQHALAAARRAAKQQTRTPLPQDIDVGLWEALREQRRLLAEEQGVPPYVIFHDSTLQEMCLSMPADVEQFGHLSGVGERKRDKYVEAFLTVIAAHS